MNEIHKIVETPTKTVLAMIVQELWAKSSLSGTETGD